MQHQELSRSQSDAKSICAICHKPVEANDYRDQKLNLDHVITLTFVATAGCDQKLNLDHVITLTFVATAGDAFLPHAIEVHGECLKELQQELMEKNRGYTWR